MCSCWCGRRSAIIDSGMGSHLGFCLWCIWHVSQFWVICWISAFIVGQYQNCFARLYDLSAPVWYWCSWFRSGFLSVFGMISELLLWTIMFPHSVSWIYILSQMVEYSFAGFDAGICFGFLYVLSACISSLYSRSSLAVCMCFDVGRSSVSYPEALMTLIFACFWWGFNIVLSLSHFFVWRDIQDKSNSIRASARMKGFVPRYCLLHKLWMF